MSIYELRRCLPLGSVKLETSKSFMWMCVAVGLAAVLWKMCVVRTRRARAREIAVRQLAPWSVVIINIYCTGSSLNI